MAIRKILVTVVGHVDHGKTTLLDTIRHTTVAAAEKGGITQAVGVTIVPLATIKKICGKLLEVLKQKITVPGLLCIDTPGHAAFTSLRKRGGSLADIAILVVDINEGFKPQTLESMEILKAHKVPFIVAANKIDLIPYWKYDQKKLLLENINELDYQIQGEFEKRLYGLVGQFQEHDLQAERFDRVSDYTKQLAGQWENISKIYDGKTYEETQWHFFKMRPQNFPTVRIAGGVHIIYTLLYGGLLQNLVKKIDEIRNLGVLINSLRSLFVIRSSGFWQKHYVFDQPANGEIKYFVGASRADEMIINVVLPFMSVYFDIFGNEELSKKVLKLYNIYTQDSDNKIVRDVAEGLELNEYLKRTIYSQGMIELFRSKCSKNKCLECEIGKVVFN